MVIGEKMETRVLKKLQTVELDILKQIHRFCERNEIKYSLYAGTALGAVRHEGFIPWDDDVDIVMTRNEYCKFIKAWKQNPIAGFFMENTDTDEKCSINHTKIRKNGTILLSAGEDITQGHHGIWIDIFVFDKVKIGFWSENSIYYNGLKRVLLTRGNRRSSTDNIRKKVIKKILSLVPENIRKNQLKKANHNIQKYDLLEDNFRWSDTSAVQYIKVQFPKELTSSYTKIQFEDNEFLIFEDYDTLLKIEYGDYMKLPPLEEQICKHNPVQILFED